MLSQRQKAKMAQAAQAACNIAICDLSPDVEMEGEESRPF
jgi:hypothetical protein